MNTDKKISRREALKRMGFAVMSSAIASSGLLSLASCETKRSKRIIFYFTGTGNRSLHRPSVGWRERRIVEYPSDGETGEV